MNALASTLHALAPLDPAPTDAGPQQQSSPGADDSSEKVPHFMALANGETVRVVTWQDCMGEWHCTEEDYDLGLPIGHGADEWDAYRDLRELLECDAEDEDSADVRYVDSLGLEDLI
ncbi:MAG TPA: hypothetical protein VEC57_20820 [Candidatus Limnocylindrales bacterium]|nr:hypothetical protein [Candidatus Limnocylindrales bacterium]